MVTEVGRKPDVFETIRSPLCNYPDAEATLGHALVIDTERNTRAFEEGTPDSSTFGEFGYSIEKETARVSQSASYEERRIEQ